MFYKDASSRRVQRFDETKRECSQRIWDECRQLWNQGGPEQDELRRTWSLLAINMNKTAADTSITIAEETRSHSAEIVGATTRNPTREQVYPYLQLSQAGSGVLGMGDAQFPVAVQTITDLDNAQRGFVNDYASRWRTRTSSQYSTKNVSMHAGTTTLCCYESLGFCSHCLDGVNRDFQSMTAWLRKMIADHRKSHLVQGKNKGPNVQIPHPLLLTQHLGV